MSRMTIDFGIDLGTTNSAIGVMRGTEVEIIKNNEGFENTPSAVFNDKSGAFVVGRAARERLNTDPQNAYAEFKLQMGTGAEYVFARTGRRMKPEDLSAEVLKSLKAEVRQRMGEEVDAAVITVPAAFELPQCQATYAAAQLAGISFSPLVQEPIAAAMAYGFQHKSDEKVFWLVYDLGGGTFDAAVMQVHEGVIRVVNHGGDNHLGGKLIDWGIVEQLFIPRLTRERHLTDFRRGNQKHAKAIAKLKLAAEEGKVRVSRDRAAEVLIESLCLDDNGDPVDFEFDLHKADVERIADPVILRSVNICREVLTARHIGFEHVEKVILVGGPTLIPYLRERLADPKGGLGIPLDFSVDPLTIVARGAAIFAGTQRNENHVAPPAAPGRYAIEFDYKPIGLDPEFMVGGRGPAAENEDLSGLTVEFARYGAAAPWRSPRTALNPDGTFVVMLEAEPGRENTFTLELIDAGGRRQEAAPARLTYKFGTVLDSPTLIHSIGIALVNNEVRTFFEKGTPLPVRKRFVQQLAIQTARGGEGASGQGIHIPVVEGEHKKADRNKLIGHLTVNPSQLKRDLPVGTEVEITIDIDQSRLVRTEAYIAVLDKEFEAELRMTKDVPELGEMENQVRYEKERLEKVREQVYAISAPELKPILEKIEDEQMLEEVEGALDAARADRDAADKCQNRLLDLKAAVDQLEEKLESPRLLAEAREMIEWTEHIVGRFGKPADQRKFEQLKAELAQAVSARPVNMVELTRKTDQLDSLRVRVLTSRDEWWVDYFIRLEESRAEMTNQELADQLFAQGRRAIDSEEGDIEGLKSACRQLVQLLPARRQQAVGRFKSTIM